MGRLSLENISKVFNGNRKVLDNISFEVESDEFLVLVGPSGCGKTTILRIISGLEDPTAGNIWFDGQLFNNVPPGKRKIGMVFQNYALYPHLTVAENIAFPLVVAKENKKQIEIKIQEIAKMLHLESALHKKPKELSGGERQRVALGRAIARRPNFFLFDEPLSNLDAKLRVEMRTEIINLVRQIGVPSIYVTHDQIEALTMGSKIIVLNDGKIQQIGTAEEIYNQPQNLFVATFVGTPKMNIFEALSDGEFVSSTNELFKFVVESRNLLPKGKIFVGIRPENLLIVPEINADFIALIETVEFLGYDTIVYFRHIDEIYSILARKGQFDYKSGETIGVKIQKEKAVFFDEKGKRIDVGGM